MRKVMLKHFGRIRLGALPRHAKGFTFTEVLFGIIVLGFVIASVPAAMIVVHNMQARQDERSHAEYLTRSQLESIKSQPYIWGNVTGDCIYKGYPPCYDKIQFTENYYLDIVAIPISSTTYEPLPVLSGPNGPYVNDEGIQEIIIYAYSDRNPENMAPVLVTSNYKVALGEE